MIKLIFVTHNPNKVKEIKAMTAINAEILTLDQIGCMEEIEETEKTLEANALLKARYVHSKFGLNCFADDTGLEVKALGGLPGVFSARYAGTGKNDNDNIDKLLQELKDSHDRTARFRTVLSIILDGEEMLFEGIVEGTITTERKGMGGFGYDPVFIPEGYNKTFAELPLSEKNVISHRYKAFKMLADYLMSLNYL